MADMHMSVKLRIFFDQLAAAAAGEILPQFRNPTGLSNKDVDGYDPVTDADRRAEAVMRRMIVEAFPDHGIDGEEYGVERIDAEHVWVLDPIDGTRGFIIGLPTWGTLIGLLRNGRPVLGMMHQPFIGESFFGDGDRAEHVRQGTVTPLRTRSCDAIGDAVLLTTAPGLFDRQEYDAFGKVSAAARLTRFGTDCYGYCMVAAGQADLVIETGLKNQDIAPLIPIIEGAGGVVTSWDGGPAVQGGRAVASGDPRLHEKVLRLLNS